MGWLRRLFGGGGPSRVSTPGGRRRTDGPDMDVDLAAVSRYAREWSGRRRGVEGYVEPATHVTTTTLVLVAHDGEWTRRAVGSLPAGFRLCREIGLPVYDVNQVGYPSRMREWSGRQRRG